MSTEGDTAAEAPVIQDGTFVGSRGRRIYWRSWSPAGDQQPKATIAIAHGLTEHLGRYAHVAERLVRDGYAVYALDHHGHGRSEGARGRVNLADAVTDLDQLVSLIAENPTRAPLFLLGHGFGGAIAVRYALLHQMLLDGLVLSAPLAATRTREQRFLKSVIGAFTPWLPMTRIDPKWLSSDPGVVARYIMDELVIHRAIPGGTVREAMAHVRTLPEVAPKITVPTLVMYGTADRICPPSGSVALTNHLGSEDLTTQAYEGLYHELLNEPEHDLVMDQVVHWLDTHTTSRNGS